MIQIAKTLIAGDTLTGSASYSDYPADDGWSLTVSLFSATAAYSFSGVADGSSFELTVTAATTAAWTPGRYDWSAYVTKGADRFSVAAGSIDIYPDPSLGIAADVRSHARKMLDAIEAMLEKRASTHDLDILEGALNSRSYKREGNGYLLQLRDRYRVEVAGEERAQRIANGENLSQTLKTRF